MHQRQPALRRSAAISAAFAVFAALFVGLVSPPSADAQGAPVFVFHGGGWGHGVGMSQNGARNMADQGHDHVAILAHYYPNTVILPTPALGDIRVHIGDATRVEMTSGGTITFERNGTILNSIGSGTINIAAHDGGLQVGSVWTTASPNDPVMVTFPQPVKISNNGHRYLWGKFQLTNRNGKVRVVEVLPLEQYVAGIAEMPAAWPLEALMAQAIAARTYAHEVTLHRRASTEWAQEYDISGTTVDQNYIGWDAQDGPWDAKWTAAVKATQGVEIVDGNGPVRAYYSASNGGWTETASYVFNNDVSHTVAAPDPWDAGGHEWTEWTRTYTQSAMSRWLNAHGDTAVGTLTAINVLGGHGASGRLDKATVELVGTSGTKRVTGKRLMLVMNSGIFGEGMGLDDHLPGTYTTIGNGVSAGFPQASGQSIPATVTPDAAADADADFTPPPGWEPEPGTGVAPLNGDDSAAAVDAGDDADEQTATADDATDTDDAVDGETSAPAGDRGFTPPPGWEPEPGTGVPPIRLDAGSAGDATDDDAVGSDADDVSDTSGDDAADEQPVARPSFVPPPGWEPQPGTGVPPIRLDGGSASGTAASESTSDTATVGGSGGGFTPPPGWEPEPGTGVPPVAAGTASDTTTVGGTGGGYVPPPGWEPEPGTGVAPIAAPGSLASTVLLVTRTADEASDAQAQFRVLAPTEALADEARVRLQRLQTQAALALFADFDIDGYVEAVAPRPVHGVCTATEDGITCASIEALQTADATD